MHMKCVWFQDRKMHGMACCLISLTNVKPEILCLNENLNSISATQSLIYTTTRKGHRNIFCSVPNDITSHLLT